MKKLKDDMRAGYKHSDVISLERGKFHREVATILEPLPEAEAPTQANPGRAGEGSVAVTLALLRSPEFLALPKSDPAEVEQRIQDLRNDWERE